LHSSWRNTNLNSVQEGTDLKLELRDYPRIAIFVGLIAALGVIPAIQVIPGVPVTAQTLGVMLAGAVLGSYRGTLAVLMFELLTLAGLPLLAGGRGGLSAFVGPTAGYLFGWIIGVWVIGFVIENLPKVPLFLSSLLAFVLGGIVAIYVPGILWYAYTQNAPVLAVAQGNLVFLVGDSLKIAVALAVLIALKAAYPKALR
jgi:biotin transport system substrate-specific component